MVGPMQSVAVDDWTTTNMDYGNFYHQSGGNRKLQNVTSQGEGEEYDIHAECKRQLEAIRKELEECQAQVRLQQNTIVNMSAGRPTDQAADMSINESMIAGGEAQQHINNNKEVTIKSHIKATAKPATQADHSTSRKSDILRMTKVGGRRNNVVQMGDAVMNHSKLPISSSSRIRQTCSFSST